MCAHFKFTSNGGPIGRFPKLNYGSKFSIETQFEESFPNENALIETASKIPKRFFWFFQKSSKMLLGCWNGNNLLSAKNLPSSALLLHCTDAWRAIWARGIQIFVSIQKRVLLSWSTVLSNDSDFQFVSVQLRIETTSAVSKSSTQTLCMGEPIITEFYYTDIVARFWW